MKQVYKKKPEYLNVVKVEHNLDSVSEVAEMIGRDDVKVSFNKDTSKIEIEISDTKKIVEGQLLFMSKDGVPMIMDEEKVLVHFDLYDEEKNVPNIHAPNKPTPRQLIEE